MPGPALSPHWLLALTGCFLRGASSVTGGAKAAASPGARPPPLAWPEACEPLLRRREAEGDYPWAQRCGGYDYNGDEHQDALFCGVEGRWLHSTVCELFRLAAGCEQPWPCRQMVVTAETLQAGIRRGQAPLPRGAGEFAEVLLSRAAAAAVEASPEGELPFPAFLGMFTITELCLRNHTIGSQRIFHLRPETLGREGCRDLVAEHFEHVFEAAVGAASSTRRGSPSSVTVRKHVLGLLPEGPLGVADAEPAETRHYAQLPGEEAWARFVVRAPRGVASGGGTERGDKGWLARQEVWGWQNAWAAVRLASRLEEFFAEGADETDETTALDAWLDALGAERQKMRDGRDSVEGERQQVGYRRWRNTQRTLTPISGQYRAMWRAALLRRAAEPAAAELFAQPDGGDAEGGAARGWRCGAVVSWAELPMGCEAAGRLAGRVGEAAAASLEALPSLVPAPGGGACRVVLSRAILRSPADAAALRKDCAIWYGVPVVMHNASYAVRPQWLHADFTAVELLQRVVLPSAMRNVSAAVRGLRDRLSSNASGEHLAEQVLRAADRIAEFTYYLFNGAIYTRGSAAIANLAHHAMFLWMAGAGMTTAGRAELARHRLQALRCLPNWRAQAMPDIEASASHTAGHYVQDGHYWASFDHGAADPKEAREALARCLAAALRPPAAAAAAAAAARGRRDAGRMRDVLQELERTGGLLSS